MRSALRLVLPWSLFRLAAGSLLLVAGLAGAQGRVYRLACEGATSAGELHSVAEVNAIHFQPGDTLLVERGGVCAGSLSLTGSGTPAQPVRVMPEGNGAAPIVRASPGATEAVRLLDGSDWQIEGLEIQGGTRRGLYVTVTRGTAERIVLRDLYVHDVFGPLLRKEDGLVVVAAQPGAAIRHLQLDGIIAGRTTLWSGIFVSGAEGDRASSDVLITNSVAHDVQGDGIVLFQLTHGVIRNASAWHTGMQHSYTIGTPNAIWTWRCTDCTVEDSEAFLVDSPGVDGGAFDIDFGNTDNHVLHNFGHHTQGYCVSVFGAFGPTRSSEIAHNTCLKNGQSPRLAARQGALFFMTWSGGTLANTSVHDNRIDWDPNGNTPAIQSGEALKSEGLTFARNVLRTAVNPLVAPVVAQASTLQGSSTPLPAANVRQPNTRRNTPVQLELHAGATLSEEDLRYTLARMSTLAQQFGTTQLRVGVSVPACRVRLQQIAMRWNAALGNLHLQTSHGCSATQGVLQVFVRGAWESLPFEIDRAVLWEQVSKEVGEPDFSPVSFLQVQAHD